MVAFPSLTHVGDTVEIDCSGLDSTRSVQFLIDSTVRGTIPVDLVGNAALTYLVPNGPQKNAIADINHADGKIDTVDGVNLVFIECDSGSMALRYAA